VSPFPKPTANGGILEFYNRECPSPEEGKTRENLPLDKGLRADLFRA